MDVSAPNYLMALEMEEFSLIMGIYRTVVMSRHKN